MPNTHRAWRAAMLPHSRGLKSFALYSSGLALRQRSRAVTVISAVPSTHRARHVAMLSQRCCLKCFVLYLSGLAFR